MHPRLAGVLLALGAFSLWGLFPLYWKQLTHVDPTVVLAHRVLWSVPFVGIIIAVGRRFGPLVETLRDPRRLGVLAVSAALISVNWGVYIWAMGVNKVIEASMGYFLTPLVNVVIGMAVFRERFDRAQWLAVAIAAAGVLYLFVAKGVAPWVALVLGASFSTYGAIRKNAVTDAFTGLFVETLVVAPVAIGYLLLVADPARSGFGDVSGVTDLLLIGAGAVTASPLLLFVAATRRLHYSTVGLLFYLTPSMQFVIGAAVYRESLLPADLVAFACIWIALALFASRGLVDSQQHRPQ